MIEAKEALLLIGNAKPVGSSASEALGNYLLQQLKAHGWQSRAFHISRVIRTEKRTEQFIAALDQADLWVVASPLYVDTLPYLVTALLERVADRREQGTSITAIPFAAISNCGFPEPAHNEPALRAYRLFAEQAGFNWRGGLGQGGGQPMSGKPLEESGGMTISTRAALDLAARALAEGKPIPRAAIDIMAEPYISPKLYRLMGEFGWRWQALVQRAFRKLRAQPYLE